MHGREMNGVQKKYKLKAMYTLWGTQQIITKEAVS